MNEPPAPPFHHTLEELEFAYRRAKRPIERTRWQVIWLKRKAKTTTEISDVVGYRPDTICKLVARYFAYGEDALVDRRQFNRSELALNPQQQAQLLNALQTEREDQGLWTSAKVRLYVEERFGIHITEPCAWGYLRRLGFSVQVPRPTHLHSASEEQKTAFKKKWRLHSG